MCVYCKETTCEHERDSCAASREEYCSECDHTSSHHEPAELDVDAHCLPRPAPTTRAPYLFHQVRHAGERGQQLFALGLKPCCLLAESGVLDGECGQALAVGRTQGAGRDTSAAAGPARPPRSAWS